MKNARNNGQKRVKNCLKWTASGLLLALMFVLVFAGTLSGAFGIENELQQNGIIQSNVASAASGYANNAFNFAESDFGKIVDIPISSSVASNYQTYKTEDNSTTTFGEYSYANKTYFGFYKRNSSRDTKTHGNRSVVSLRVNLPANTQKLGVSFNKLTITQKMTDAAPQTTVGGGATSTGSYGHTIDSDFSITTSLQSDDSDFGADGTRLIEKDLEKCGNGSDAAQFITGPLEYTYSIDTSSLAVSNGMKTVYLRFSDYYWKDKGGSTSVAQHAWGLFSNLKVYAHYVEYGTIIESNFDMGKNHDIPIESIEKGDWKFGKESGNAILNADFNQRNDKGFNTREVKFDQGQKIADPTGNMLKVSWTGTSELRGPFTYEESGLTGRSVGINAMSGDDECGEAILTLSTNIKVPKSITEVRLKADVFAAMTSIEGPPHNTEYGVYLYEGKDITTGTPLASQEDKIKESNSNSTNVEKKETTVDLRADVSNVVASADGYRTITLVLKMKAIKNDKQYAGDMSAHMLLMYNLKMSYIGHYQIAYDGNNSTSGSMENQVVLYGKKSPLNINQFERERYEFVEWNTNADGGGTKFADGASIIPDLTAKPSTTDENGTIVYLYAQWKEAFLLIYHSNVGPDNDSIVKHYEQFGEPIELYSAGHFGENQPLSSFRKNGYYFVGWADTDNSDIALQSPIIAGANGQNSQDIYAIWKPIGYTVLFEGNGATVGTMAEIGDSFNNADLTLPANKFHKDDAFFEKWTVTISGEISDEISDKTYYFTNTTNAQDAVTIAKSTLAEMLTRLQNSIETQSVSFTLNVVWATDFEFGNYANGTGQWGSSTNPYVIRNLQHLKNLSSIIENGTGLSGSMTGSQRAWITNPQAINGDGYKDSYFVLANNISGVGNITPIGGNTHPFKGNFDGNYKAINGLNINKSGNYIGLFGYVSGATIKNLTVNGSVKGSQYVGGVVGYALNSTIENVTNNASVNADYTDISYTIRQVDATPVSGGDKNYPSGENAYQINDGNVGTKYCGTKKAPMSFIAEINNVQSIVGFAIQNATDTSGNPQRTPKKVTIWGSNNGNEIPSQSWGQSGNGNKPTSWPEYTSWVEIYTSDDIKLQSTDNRKNIEFDSTHTYRYYWVYIEGTDKQLQFAEFDFLSPRDNIGGVVGYASGTNIKNATNNGNIVGGSNVGGIVGYSVNSNIITATNTKQVVGDTRVGGIVGYSDSTSRMYGTIVNSGNITADSMVGGVSGENHGLWCDINSEYGTFNNSGEINGRNGATVGGVTAFADKEMHNAVNTGKVIGGNAVGGIAGRVQAHIRNSYNSGEIVGTNPTVQSEINGNPTGVFVGGITGYTTANSEISNCYNTGTIAAHSASNGYIANGDYVGGIVGFAQAKVEYCANIGGLIDGNNYIGGIVGSALSATKINCCYDVQGQRQFRWDGCNHGSITGSGGNVTNSWAINEKQVQTTANNPNPVVSTKGYRLTTAFAVTPQVDLQNTTNQKWEDILSSKINGFKVVGSVAKNEFFCSDNGTDTKYVKPSKTEGFAGDNGDVTAWYSATIASNIRVSVQKITLPNLGSKEYDGSAHGFGHTTYPNTTNGATANSPIVYTTEFLYVGTTYKENLNVSPTNVDVYNTTVTIKIDGQIVGVKKGDTVTITERLLKVSNVWTSASEHAAGDTSNVYIFHYNTQHQGIIENGISVASVHGGFAIPQNVYTIGGYVETKQAHNDTTHTRTFTLNDIRNYKIENKYSQYDDFSPNTVLTEDTLDRGISEAMVGDTIVVTYTWKIVPYSLATNIISGNVWFGGTKNLIVGNQGIANVKVGNTNEGYYPLQADRKGTGVQQVLVYAQHNYAAGNFVLYVKYNNGKVATLEQGEDKDYTVGTLDVNNVFGTFNVNVVSQAKPVADTNVTARGTGNFSGDITKYYTALYSDFGGNVTSANWGSAGNPYVISKPEHLLRLSQIVNGGMAWNSIITTNNALCISPQGTAFATDRAYSGAYFLVTADIDMTGNVSTDGVYNFLPIGHRNEQSQTDMPFSGTFDGNGKAITFVYNTENFGNGARVDYVGLFGYLNGATVTDLIAKSIQVNGIKGRNYVGGIVGYAENSHLVNVQKSYGDGVVGENYVGGIVGYADNTWLEVEKDYGNAITNANVGGMQYVGGIVGKWIVRSEDQIGGDAAGQAKITLPHGQKIHGVKYVGGLVGWLDTSSCTSKVEYTPQLNNNGEKVGVTGTEYVGALFGALIGNGYHKGVKPEPQTGAIYTAIGIDSGKVNNITLGTRYSDGDVTYQSKVVGGLVGYVESAGLVFVSDWNTANIAFDLQNVQDAALSFFGGIVGVLGQNATMEALYEIKADGTYLFGGSRTITNDTTFGASNPLGSFVGGIVGYVSSQAGTYWDSTTTIFGNGIALVNSANIYAKGYVGGIFGALGDISENVAQTFENDKTSILYKVLTTGVRKGNANTTLGIAPATTSEWVGTAVGKLHNTAGVSATDKYVGGIAGYSGAKVRFVLRNTPQTGAIATENLNVYSGGNDIYINGSYAGGIAGYLADNLEHELQYIVVQAKFESVNAKRVGGLVGYMGSGKVENCVVTNGGNSNVNELTDTFKGSEYVGGLVGETQNAIITNSVSTGFNLDKTTNTKGGLLGGGTNPTIESSWTFYIANSGATYQTVSKNTYGKYILVDTDIVTINGSSYPTFENLCGFAGIASKQGVTKGVLEFAVRVPSATDNDTLKNKQLAFYNASGSDVETSNKDSFKGFENRNNVLTIKLDMASGTSMQICLLSVRFVNVPKCSATSTEQDKIDIVEATYVKPSNSTRYHVGETTADFDTTGTSPTYQVTHIVANVFFDYNGDMVYIGTAESSEKTGSYDSGPLTPGTETNPYTISSQKEWDEFAYSVYDGNQYIDKFIKLLANVTVTGGHTNFANNGGYNFAGDVSKDSDTNNFHGTFDGNGCKITISFEGVKMNRVSVFPNAAGATFKNLTIDGVIRSNTAANDSDYTGKWNAGYDVASFVGKPFEWVAFYNCTNLAKVSGLRNAGGFVGYTNYTVTAEACVNKGDIYSSEGINKSSVNEYGWVAQEIETDDGSNGYKYANVTLGTGGIIGNSNLAQTIESCMNTGYISGGHNVGGIIGRANGDLTIKNCANVGDIVAHSGAEKYGGEDTEEARYLILSYVGGIVGKTSRLGTIDMDASYNTGVVTAWGSISGGLIGSVGNYVFGNANISASDATKHKDGALAKISRCYNTGLVQSGGTYAKESWRWTFGRLEVNGQVSGGIVGSLAHSEISYCYNLGEVITHSLIGGKGTWQARVGGIAGQVLPNKNSSEYVKFNNCYNVGYITLETAGTNFTSAEPRYGASISGYCDNSDSAQRVSQTNSFGLAYNVRYRNTRQKKEYIYNEYNKYNTGTGWSESFMVWGSTINSLADFSAVMNDDGSVRPEGSFGETHIANAKSLEGYVYMPGCLPQLAVFAVDTYNGLSMKSIVYGNNDYGDYDKLKAGGKQNPYIIKDGIDMLGMQALLDAGYNFDNQYIEFANGSNNITLDKQDASVVSKEIEFPTYTSTSTKLSDDTTAYKSKGSNGGFSQTGKSYQLFAKGAICGTSLIVAAQKDLTIKVPSTDGGATMDSISTEYDKTEDVNDAYKAWLYKAHYYNGEYNDSAYGEMRRYSILGIQNYIVAREQAKAFKGNLSGRQANGTKNTIINNLRITAGNVADGAYAGLFGIVEDAYIGYIEIGGSSRINAYSYNNTDTAAVGAITGNMLGNSVIEHCGVSGTTSLGAYGQKDNIPISSNITYAGGIVGIANTSQSGTYNAGVEAAIKSSTVNITLSTSYGAAGIIQACKSNIGGVLGYVGGDAGASGKGNSVRIEGCEVQKAAIQAASSATESSHIGGVLGYGSEYVAAFITGCSVGNGADTVTIKGEHSLGGIAGGMSNAKGGYIDSCTVGTNTTIERINQGGGNISENPKHGTAIGGLVGFTEDSTDTTSPLTTTFSGTSAFNGTITVSVEASYQSSTLDAKISCIGGIVGDMGSGANFASGSDVTVDGTINITLAAANVGGVAGRTNTATFIGKFNVSPNMTTPLTENVGGFIGKNVGTVYILADTTERIVDGKLNGTNITIGGTISGTSEVGGFIGVNNSGSSLNIGSNVANAKPYKSGTLSITIAEGAEISGSGNHVGGIVGKNEGAVDAAQNDYATIDIVKGTIVQNGTISGKNYVGGIIGLNQGLLTTGGGEADEIIGGIALSDDQIGDIKNLSITNKGSVKGGTPQNAQSDDDGQCVGGVIGWLDAPQTLRPEHMGKGDIAGAFTNSGSVEGNRFVGGSLGYVGKYVNIATKGDVNTLFVNTGNVTAHSTFVGGSIGSIVGQITGAKVGTTVNFENTGTVNGLGYVGGSIGVLAGQTQFAQFVNSSKKDFTIDACNSVGGSVGYIGMPDALKTILNTYFKDNTYSNSDITVKNVHFEASGNLTANPSDATLAAAKDDGKGGVVDDNDWGGVGGAIGVLGRNQLATWENNTYYANGNVIAEKVNNVGGIIGLINAKDITIGNLLAYNITVTGAKNVGGIVGATTGAKTVINSAYTYAPRDNFTATATSDKNVGGIIGAPAQDTVADTSYWILGCNNADIAGYDIKNLTGLGFSTGTEKTGWYFLYATDANGTNGLGTINTNHQGGGEIELKYWKRIANAYTAQERADKIDTQPLDPPSGIVSGGQPQHATLYATATAASVNGGYYLYTATTNNDVTPTIVSDAQKYFISVTTNAENADEAQQKAGNVAVFYRRITKGDNLKYNGYNRNAVVGMDGVNLHLEEPKEGDVFEQADRNKYFYTTSTNAEGEGAVGSLTADPGTYKSTIKIYLVDNDGKANSVGGIENLEWKIDSRELTVKYEGETSRPYGSVDLEDNNKRDKTITITNIAPNFGKGVPIKIVIKVGNDTVEEYTWTWNNDNATGVFTATHKSPDVKLIATAFSESGDTLSTEDQAFSINMGDTNLYKLECALKFVNAKNYTIEVVGDNKSNPRYTVKTEGDSSLNVTPVKLTLKIMDGLAQSQAFDGKAKGTVWVVDGFKYNDGIQQFALFDPSFNVKYKDNVVRSEKMTSGNMQTGVTIESGPMVQATHPIQGKMEITLSNAIKRGDYYLTFAKTSAGNYTLDNQGSSFSIAETTIAITCDKNGQSKTYDQTSTELTFTFTASVPNNIQGFEGIANYSDFLSEFFKINGKEIDKNSIETVDNKTAKVTLSTDVNAKRYSFTFSKGAKYDDHIRNCAHTPTTLPTYVYTITPRPLTLTTTLTEMPNGASQYTYNTSHQGLSKIKVDNLVANDTIGVIITIGTKKATVELENNNAKDVTDKVSTIDAGTYSVSFALSTNTSYPQNENYTLTATDVTWKIDKYRIMVGEFNIGANKTYNAEAEVPKINVTNSEVSGNGTTFNYGTDTFTLEYSVSYNGKPYAGNKLVNAGTYKINIGTSNGKIIAKHSDGTDASDNYEFGNSATEHPYVINPCPIEIVWESRSFVYNTSNHQLNVASIKINNTTKNVSNNTVQTGLGKDKLTFNRGGGGTDVGSYTTNVTSHSVSGEPNDGVRPISANYKIEKGATSGTFNIIPSKLEIFYAGGTTSKVYDAGFGISGKPFVFNTQSQNGGAHGTSELFDISYVYKDKNVGNDKEVVFTYVLKQNANYEYVGTGTESQNKGQITPAHIKVALDKLRSGKATRTFTNDERYGGNGASGNNRSQIYRAGEGFSVSGVLGNDSIVVTASYREALDSRNGTGNSFDLSKYVNDVEKNENTFTKVASGTYYKTLVFNLTGDDAANYTFNVYRGENKFGENDSTASASQNITVYDSRDKASGHQNASGAEQIKIEITVKPVRVEYSNTSQSYANDDNTYNKNWLRVTGTNKDMQGAGAEIVVTNGWMYQDGKDRPADSTDEKREYHGYTTIRGSQNSERLGAAVSKVNGMDLNYRLSNQPVLTIAYFVADGGEYKIDSLARLLIASFYYTAHQNPGDLEIVKIVSSGYQWVTVVSNDKYEKNEEIPAGFETWDAYFAKLKDDGYEVFLNVEEIKDGEVIIPANTWGYYQSTSNTDAALPTSYKLTKDISGKFTQSDIAILNTFFTVTTVGDDGHITQTEYTWSGANSDYLKNVLSAAVDKVATINGSLFVSQKAEGAAAITGFDSTFDGNGYVIEYLNIMGYDKENVGLFDIIGANGSVKNLHLRNITINANQGNVGGIAGSIGATESDAAKNVTNVSFHGKITATGGTVGGLFGTSARAIDGAIVLGEISATNANVGGVVGTATAGLNNVVSMMQITASGGTVGAFTSDNAHVGENCTHMTNTVWKKGTSGTGFVNVKDKNVSYNALMSGSNSLYANGTSDLGTYDVISETFADSGQNVNPRQSKRLRDMVSVYLLMYSLSANGDKYTISSSSWLVGTADGTDNNKIVIANKQNVSLLRELRFAAFVLKVNVSIDVARTFTGAFYGSVTSAVNESGVSYGYKITCNKPMFEAYATEPPAWLVTPTQP